MLAKVFSEKKQDIDTVHIIACTGLPFNLDDYNKLKHSSKNERIFFYNQENPEKAVENIIDIATDNLDTRLVIDLSIYRDSGQQYEDFKSIRIAKKALASKKIKADNITFYSRVADRKAFEELCPDFKLIHRPDNFSPAYETVFYNFITNRGKHD